MGDKYMIAFLLYLIAFGFGTGCFIARIIWPSIQQDQIFGKWQDVLQRMDENGYGSAAKFLGYCELCFSHFCTILSFIVFVVFCVYMPIGFPPFGMDYLVLKILFTLLCWSLYSGISVTMALWLLRPKNT